MSIKAVSKPLQAALRATLCEIEHGVFYVTYPDMDVTTGLGFLSFYQVSPSAADARQQVEHDAFALGYESVIWNDANIAPLFPIDPLQVLAGQKTIYAAHHSLQPH